MLNTLDANGQISSRPMTLQDTEFDGDIWFFAQRSAAFMDHIETNSEVNVTFANPEDMSFLSANGNATIVNDDAKKRELWKPLYKAWFPEGLEDPDLRLIKVSVQSADYWEAPESKLLRMIGFAKAAITGKHGELSGKHGHLN